MIKMSARLATTGWTIPLGVRQPHHVRSIPSLLPGKTDAGTLPLTSIFSRNDLIFTILAILITPMVVGKPMNR